MWKLLDTGVGSAKTNMDLDTKLLRAMQKGDCPILHYYQWERDSGTYGYFLRPEKYLNLSKISHYNLELARRPTGGGIIFHICDFAFSVLVPADFSHFSLNTLDNYNFINNGVKKAVKNFLQLEEEPSLLRNEKSPLDENAKHFCMGNPTIFDVIIEGKKIAGAAQRRGKQGYLHQGSIAIALPEEGFLKEILLPGTEVLKAMQQNAFSILGSNYTPSDLEEVRHELRYLLKNSLSESFHV